MVRKRVAIIGGGISGIAAAFYLQKHSNENKESTIDWHLFESSDRFGGVIKTINATDESEFKNIVELGADNFATLLPDALQLTRDAGIEDLLVRPNADHRLARVVCNGKIFPIPTGFSLVQPNRLDAILKTPVLTWKGKLRVLAEYFIKARSSNEDEGLESFVTRRLGREAYERLVEPIVGGIFTADGSTLSMLAALPQYVAMEREHGGLIRASRAVIKSKSSQASQSAANNASGARYDQFMAPRFGMQDWIDRIVATIPSENLHKATAVESIERTSHGDWTFNTVDIQSSERSSRQFDSIILAVPSKVAAKLLSNVSDSFSNNLSDELAAIPYADSAVVCMLVDRAEVSPLHLCFGIVVPKLEKRDCLAISFTSEKYPNRVASDKFLLRVFMGGAVRPELMMLDDETLFEKAWHEVAQLLGLSTKPTWHHVVRWPSAMPQYLIGHTERVARIEGMLKDLPGIYLAGNAYAGVGIPQCIRSGKQAALLSLDAPPS